MSIGTQLIIATTITELLYLSLLVIRYSKLRINPWRHSIFSIVLYVVNINAFIFCKSEVAIAFSAMFYFISTFQHIKGLRFISIEVDYVLEFKSAKTTEQKIKLAEKYREINVKSTTKYFNNQEQFGVPRWKKLINRIKNSVSVYEFFNVGIWSINTLGTDTLGSVSLQELFDANVFYLTNANGSSLDRIKAGITSLQDTLTEMVCTFQTDEADILSTYKGKGIKYPDKLKQLIRDNEQIRNKLEQIMRKGEWCLAFEDDEIKQFIGDIIDGHDL